MPVQREAIVEHPSDAEAIPSAEASDGLGEASAHGMATGPGIPQATYGPTHSGNVAKFSSGTAGSSGTGSSVHVDHTIGHDSYECNHVNGVTFPPRVSSSAGAGEVRPISSVSGGHSFGGNLLGSPAALGGQPVMPVSVLHAIPPVSSGGTSLEVSGLGRLPVTTGGIGQTSNALVDAADSLHNIGRPLPVFSAPGGFSALGLDFYVPQATKEKIWRSEYVDLAGLYRDNAVSALSAANASSSLALALDGGQVVLRLGGPQKRKLDSIEKWTSAFHVFMAVFTTSHPGRIAELLKYAETVKTASLKFPGFGWRSNDEQFRLRQEQDPL